MSLPSVSNNLVVLKIKSCQNKLIKWSSNLKEDDSKILWRAVYGLIFFKNSISYSADMRLFLIVTIVQHIH